MKAKNEKAKVAAAALPDVPDSMKCTHFNTTLVLDMTLKDTIRKSCSTKPKEVEVGRVETEKHLHWLHLLK